MLTLPRGLVGEQLRQTALVRGLTGEDEAFRAGRSHMALADTLTKLLLRAGVELGGVVPTADDLSALAVGDREALLLHIRAATLGPRVDCIATCPAATCGERLDLSFVVDNVLVEPSDDAKPW